MGLVVWLSQVSCLHAQVSRFVRLDIDPDAVMWRRVVDINDRFLRGISVGQGPEERGMERKTGEHSTDMLYNMRNLDLFRSENEGATRGVLTKHLLSLHACCNGLLGECYLGVAGEIVVSVIVSAFWF
jgi:hypothetical protein